MSDLHFPPGALYEHELVVTPAMIDENQHVNNVEYVKWTLDAAVAHSTDRGWAPSRYWQEGMSWVIRTHHLDYFNAAKEGDTLIIRTWASELRRVRFKRQYEILRLTDTLHAETGMPVYEKMVTGYSDWVFVDLEKQRPMSVPQAIIEAFPIPTVRN